MYFSYLGEMGLGVLIFVVGIKFYVSYKIPGPLLITIVLIGLYIFVRGMGYGPKTVDKIFTLTRVGGGYST